MSTIKPIIGRERLHALLRDHFGDAIAEVRPLDGGQISRAFSFVAGGRAYVARFNASAAGFARDRYASQLFASTGVPVPRVVTIGQVDDLHFAISEQAPGRTLKSLSAVEYQRLLPQALDVLDRIHAHDAHAGQGFGPWAEIGAGQYTSWRDYLLAIMDDETEGFHQGWHALFRDSFLERDVYESVYARMHRLAGHCPEERSLLHGDYGFDNVLTDGARITGVIDWSNMGYGDFLYDVAWLAFWSASGDVDALLRDRYVGGRDPVPHYAERIACYQCRIGLDALRFFARVDQLEAYRWSRDRLLAIAEQAAVAPGGAEG